jgi:predicted DNA binding protein
MASGISTTVEFDASGVCPIVAVSDDADATVGRVRRSVCPGDCGGGVSEFTVRGCREDREALETVFSTGETVRYRLDHDVGVDCPCECLGGFGCPVTRYDARDGSLTLEFHATDYDELQEVVGVLLDEFPAADVTRIVRSPSEQSSDDVVPVDRGRLTARQRDVLETAYEMGYFERPREANATAVADELDIDPSTFSEHIAAAESKLLGELL